MWVHAVYALAAMQNIAFSALQPMAKSTSNRVRNFPAGRVAGRQFYHATSPRALGHDLTTGLQPRRGRHEIFKSIRFKETLP